MSVGGYGLSYGKKPCKTSRKYTITQDVFCTDYNIEKKSD